MKNTYYTPMIELLEVVVEKGFQGSNNDENGTITAPGWN